MKKTAIVLASLFVSIALFSSFASAQSNRDYILAKEKAYKDVVVVDLASCKKRAKLEYSYAFAVANANQSTSSYFSTLEQYYRSDLDACKRKW